MGIIKKKRLKSVQLCVCYRESKERERLSLSIFHDLFLPKIIYEGINMLARFVISLCIHTSYVLVM